MSQITSSGFHIYVVSPPGYKYVASTHSSWSRRVFSSTRSVQCIYISSCFASRFLVHTLQFLRGSRRVSRPHVPIIYFSSWFASRFFVHTLQISSCFASRFLVHTFQFLCASRRVFSSTRWSTRSVALHRPEGWLNTHIHIYTYVCPDRQKCCKLFSFFSPH